MKRSMIEVSGLNKNFGKRPVLSDVSLCCSRGEICGITGDNGSGKTVLMKCICGLLCPDTGIIMLNGTPIKFGSALPATVGAIIEHPGFLPFDSGFHNLLLLANIRHTITREKIRATMLRVGLDPDSKKPVRAYSLGMCQRLGIAQAIMEDPEILILDEPFNSLDQGGVSEIRRLILELKQGGTTILLASHNPEDIDTLCDSVYCVEKGTLSAIK